MAENINSEVKAVKPSLGARMGAGLKEWGRKQIVNLKRKTHYIPLFVTLIASFYYLLCLRTFSITVMNNYAVDWVGLGVFANTLFSVLVLALYLSAFPKRKKANKIFIALIFIFLVGMLLLDVVYYTNMSLYLAEQSQSVLTPTYNKSLTLSIVHIVLLGVSIIALALLPVYKKLIMKINTRKVIDASQLSEVIETSEE